MIATLLALSLFGQPLESFSTRDYALLGAAGGLIAVDLAQSVQMLRVPYEDYSTGLLNGAPFYKVAGQAPRKYAYQEVAPGTSWILGSRPSALAYAVWGTGWWLATGAVMVAMPERWRWIPPLLVSSLEVATIAHNVSIGIALPF